MKRHLLGFSVTLVSFVVLTALAATRPFHLVEQGAFTVDANGHFVSDGTGTATHLGSFRLHREATVKPMGAEVKIDDGQVRLTAANGDLLKATFTGTLNPVTNQAVLSYEWKEQGKGITEPNAKSRTRRC